MFLAQPMRKTEHQKKNAHSSNNRKILLATTTTKTKFDFSPFLHQQGPLPLPPGTEIDPLYGVEKRRVPTGPNPLHH
uniref:Uncharacterized protein n=1 Tax=Kalanchoe fedtschenkoi TaxID=63787 RepID=A0A7N0TXC1_KALFE